MPALASLDELQAVYRAIQDLKKKHPDACETLSVFLKKNRQIGYKNICKMFTGESTPEKLKETAQV